jgi:flagellar M-ring protein FliF
LEGEVMAGNFLAQMKALNEKLTLSQKLSIVALSTVILFGSFTFVYLIQNESYQLLYSNLDAPTANAVIQQLDQSGVPYSLSDGGRSISVPAERVALARIDVASQGLLSESSSGFELFDRNQWGTTDFAEKVNYQRALSGELVRTISGLAEVASARVHLVMENDALFEEDKQPAKASVVLTLRGSNRLSQKRVEGIRNLVAFSVPGLNSDNVTLVDVHGNLLSEGGKNAESTMSDVQMELRRGIEADYVEKVKSILEPLVGENKVRVSASVLLKASDTQQNEEIFDPDRTVVVSQTREEKVVKDGKLGPEGIPFQANDVGAASTDVVDRGSTTQMETVNYEVSKTVRQTRVPKGSIERLSVAVVIDNKIVETPDADGNVNETVEPRSEEEMERFQNLVAATIGLAPERGDSLVVENVSFSPIPPEETLLVSEPSFLEQHTNLILPAFRYLLVLVLFALFYFMIFRPVKNKVFSYVEVSDTDYAQLNAAGKDPALLEKLQQQLGQLEGAKGTEDMAPEPLEQGAVTKKQLATLAENDPSLVTQLIRSWLSEGV